MWRNIFKTVEITQINKFGLIMQDDLPRLSSPEFINKLSWMIRGKHDPGNTNDKQNENQIHKCFPFIQILLITFLAIVCRMIRGFLSSPSKTVSDGQFIIVVEQCVALQTLWHNSRGSQFSKNDTSTSTSVLSLIKMTASGIKNYKQKWSVWRWPKTRRECERWVNKLSRLQNGDRQ